MGVVGAAALERATTIVSQKPLISTLNSILIPIALLFLLVLFTWGNLAVGIVNGLGSADDGFFALAAKSLAMGHGYGFPVSSWTFSPFDPSLGTGPALIVPAALLTWLVGPVDWVGLLTLAVFLVQIVAAGVVLARRFGWAAAAAALFVSLVLLIRASLDNWYFSLLIGEAPALGFVLLGTICLSSEGSWRTHAVAGLLFSLAFLTKQITLFPIIGIVACWMVLVAHTTGVPDMIKRVGITLLSAVPLIAGFELAKLITLGLDGYADLWRRTIALTESMAVSNLGLSQRLAVAAKVIWHAYLFPWMIEPNYLTPVLAALFTMAFAGVTYLEHRRGLATGSRRYLPVLLWAGAFAHFCYWFFLSTQWQRYLWIGVALGCFGFGAVLLFVRDAVRSILTAAIAAYFVFVVFGPVSADFSAYVFLGASKERRAVAQYLSRQQLPFAAEGWSSLYDLLYLMNPEGKWVLQRDLALLHNQEFIAVINKQFTTKGGEFLTSVSSFCSVLVNNKRFSLHLCGKEFWDGQATGQQR